jgi:exopolysaccharide biosynthesis polyprenyl glycosylphosphotransferase
MLTNHRQLRIQVAQIRDGGLFCLALLAAHYLRANWLHDLLHMSRVIEPFHEFIWLWLIILPGAPFILESQGYYERPLVAPRRQTAWILLRSCALATIGIILVMFPLKLTLARSVIVAFGGVSFVLLFLHEELMRLLLRTDVAQAQWRRRFVLVGDAESIARMRQDLLARPEDGLDPVAEFQLGLQAPEKLIDLLHQHSANGVIIEARHSNLAQIEDIIHICELEGLEAWLVADFFKTQISRKTFDFFHGRPTLVFRCTPEASWQGVLKQILDMVGAVLLLLVSLPLLCLAAAVIRLTSPGPILFRQQRCGLNGRPFTMLKFRSMATDAEQRKHELERLNEMQGPVFKLTNDPRVTPVGRLLRKYSIDEFPQLLNVLRGDMSLVGPRPLPVDEVRRFEDIAHRRRLSVKPGLTCLWQVRGRNELRDFDEWVRLDLEYIDNWSIWLDLKILLLSIPVVLLGKGAK